MRHPVLLITSLVIPFLMISCSEDENITPDTTVVESNQDPFEEYRLSIDVSTSMEVSETSFSGHSFALHGSGRAFSETFGNMIVETTLYYGVDSGRMTGTIKFEIPNTQEQLSLRISDKPLDRSWAEFTGACLAAQTTEPFADMSFHGDLCISEFPGSIAALDEGAITRFHIQGILR